MTASERKRGQVQRLTRRYHYHLRRAAWLERVLLRAMLSGQEAATKIAGEGDAA